MKILDKCFLLQIASSYEMFYYKFDQKTFINVYLGQQKNHQRAARVSEANEVLKYLIISQMKVYLDVIDSSVSTATEIILSEHEDFQYNFSIQLLLI